MLRKYGQLWLSLLMTGDIVLIALTWIAAYYLRFFSFPPIESFLSIIIPIVLTWPFIFRNMGLYRPRRVTSYVLEIFDIAKTSTLAVIILVTTTFFLGKHEFSRLVFLYFWMISIAVLSAERLVFRVILWNLRKKGYNVRRVLIIGAGDLGVKVVNKIKDNRWTGLDIVGYLDDYKPLGEVIEGEAILGRIKDVEDVIAKYSIDQVFITLPVRAYKRLMYVVEKLSDKLVNIRIIPDIYQAMTLNAGVEEFDGLPVINLMDTPMYGWSLVLKRFADIFLTLPALIVIAPVMAVIALIIKFTSPGPVLFKQRRYGLDGKVIWIYKFRSMTVCEDGLDIPQAQKCDPRVTFFGAFLRRTSLDELPQFFNVLGGSMSIVGPRPHAVAHNEHYRKLIKGYMLRHRVKPGITGWAQVNGWRGETDAIEKMENRVRYDLFYAEHYSIWFDIKIMWLTLWKGLVSKNAY